MTAAADAARAAPDAAEAARARIESLARGVERLERGRVGALGREDALALPALYRAAIADLAEARARGVDARTLEPLEALVARAHAVLYVAQRASLGVALRGLVTAFPRAVIAMRGYVALATLLLVAGALFGRWEVARDPASAAALLSAPLRANAEDSFLGTPPRAGHPLVGTFYVTNNARVAFNAWALGATFGVGTAWIAVYNGVLLGATMGIVERVGSPDAFWSFVVPHGGIELSAIVFAAAGGLAMGDALLRPRWRRRRDALLEAARGGLPLALGAALILVVAGFVEGWFSPAPLPFDVKLAVGIGLDVLLAAWIAAGREA